MAHLNYTQHFPGTSSFPYLYSGCQSVNDSSSNCKLVSPRQFTKLVATPNTLLTKGYVHLAAFISTCWVVSYQSVSSCSKLMSTSLRPLGRSNCKYLARVELASNLQHTWVRG